jgi:hypothetical protein
MSNAVDKIQNVLMGEFPEVVFEVFDENGLLNEHSTMYTVCADGDMDKFGDTIIELAKTIFDEVFLQPGNDGPLEKVFYGLITTYEEEG